MLTPCEEPITASLSLTQSYQWYLINSLILVGVGFGPLVLAPLSEVYGRRPVLLGGSALFIVWNTAGGGVQSYDQLLAFRLLSGFGACVADALAGGVIGELWAVEERGRAFAVFMATPLLGPALGPILGAFIAQGADWRWVFWATSAAAAAVLVTACLFLPETFGPRIERKWLKKQLKQAEKQSNPATVSADDKTAIPLSSTAIPTQLLQRGQQQAGPQVRFVELMRVNLQRPLRMLLTQPIVQLLALYMAMLYGIMFIMLFAFPLLWTSVYGQQSTTASLNYISLAIGFVAGVNIAGSGGDHIYSRLRARNGGAGKPEFRLPILVLGTILMPIGLLTWGWAGEAHTHWVVPNLGALVFAAGGYTCSASVSVYTIDVYTRYGASAVSTNLVTRSLAGAFFPLFAPYLFRDLGFGRGSTVLAGSFLAVGSAAIVILWFWGEKIRAKSPYCAEDTEEVEED